MSELCNQILADLSDFEFGRLFMLLALSSFLCPNTRGACSTRYYHAVLNISYVPKYDWCSFVLDWLVSYLDKFKVHQRTSGSNVIGGCCHILVVIMAMLFQKFNSYIHYSLWNLVIVSFFQISYLEFLSSNAFDLGLRCPRLHAWSSTVVNALAFMDANSDSSSSFGKLQVCAKIICFFVVIGLNYSMHKLCSNHNFQYLNVDETYMLDTFQ